MKKYIHLLSLLIIPLLSFSQQIHYVSVDEMSFAPSSLIIEVGDQVSFTHNGFGVHDVNFTTNSITGQPFNNPTEIATLPSNGQFQSDAGLMGIITFNIPGQYNYDCSMYGHASMGMVGSITVNEQECEDNNSFVEDNFGDFFISDCESLILFLENSYNYSAFESCSWNGSPMTDFGGLTIADFCECSCEDVVAPSTTVVDIIVGSENHNTLEAAVVAAGLVDALSGEGPFTVFAPTDEAFENLEDGTLDAVLADIDLLTSILTHHVAEGSVLSTDLADGMMVPTLNGTELMVTINENGVMIDNAMVTVSDIVADNGVVHVISAVLIPEEGCEDDDSIIASAFQTLSTCLETISFLMTNYGYSEYEACNWNGDMGSGSLFNGMTMFDFCECSCEDVNNNSSISNYISSKRIIMLFDLFGRKVNNPSFNSPYFILYDDGSVKKSIILKN